MIASFKKKRYDIFLIIFFCWLGVIFSHPSLQAQSSGSLGDRLKKTQKLLQELKKKLSHQDSGLKKLQEQEKEIFQEIQNYDQQIERYRSEINLYDDKINRHRKKQESLNLEIDYLHKSLSDQERFLAGRLRSWYKARAFGFWQTILESNSIIEFAKRIDYLKAIIYKDLQLMQAMKDAFQAKEKKQEEYQLLFKEMESLRGQLASREKECQRAKEKKKQALALWKKKEKESRLNKKGLLEEQANLQQLLLDLQKKQAQSPARGESTSVFSKKRGKLRWPAQGKIQPSLRSGDLDKSSFAGGKTRGLVIETQPGAEITAISGGEVLYADWCIGYGKLLIIDHGEGYCSIYAHLSKFMVDLKERVSEGQIVARVGDTGAVSETQLYFELRYKGRSFDPIPWLR